MTTPDTSTETAKAQAAQKALFAKLNAFIGPIAASIKSPLRPFSITTFTSMQLAGIAVGNKGFADLSEVDRTRHLQALLAIQIAPLGSLKKALREANGDFEKFYWNFAFDFASEIPIEAMAALSDQLEEELPAVEAAQIEVQAPPSMTEGEQEKPPGN